jgi:hypothetical protein
MSRIYSTQIAQKVIAPLVDGLPDSLEGKVYHEGDGVYSAKPVYFCGVCVRSSWKETADDSTKWERYVIDFEGRRVEVKVDHYVHTTFEPKVTVTDRSAFGRYFEGEDGVMRRTRKRSNTKVFSGPGVNDETWKYVNRLLFSNQVVEREDFEGVSPEAPDFQ